jgi:hypothetical protein
MFGAQAQQATRRALPNEIETALFPIAARVPALIWVLRALATAFMASFWDLSARHGNILRLKRMAARPFDQLGPFGQHAFAWLEQVRLSDTRASSSKS